MWGPVITLVQRVPGFPPSTNPSIHRDHIPIPHLLQGIGRQR